MKSLLPASLIIAASILLTACGPQSPSSSGDSTDQPSSSAQINAAIPKEDVSTQLALAGHPTYAPNDDTLHVPVKVINRGKATLVSSGTNMVRLGAMLMGPEGPDKSPGKRDFVRTDLPAIAPSDSATVEAKLPVAYMNGMPVRFDLVQEGVNWFSAYGQPTLDIGPFKRCGGDNKSLCDSNDQPIPAQ